MNGDPDGAVADRDCAGLVLSRYLRVPRGPSNTRVKSGLPRGSTPTSHAPELSATSNGPPGERGRLSGARSFVVCRTGFVATSISETDDVNVRIKTQTLRLLTAVTAGRGRHRRPRVTLFVAGSMRTSESAVTTGAAARHGLGPPEPPRAPRRGAAARNGDDDRKHAAEARRRSTEPERRFGCVDQRGAGRVAVVGSFAMALRITASIASGSSGRRPLALGGSSSRCAQATASRERPANGASPVRHS